MKKLFVTFTGVTKAWAKKYKNSHNRKWVDMYKLEYFAGVLILKEPNESRLCDYKQLLKHRALVRLSPD
ncbi:hypothetical protein [Bacillus infantis]|uniref:hypothetical protein n=1 Tax=Bacillus infantis TaxID=324767 RepID=UPI003CFB4FAB